ncbi:MAG TPA: bacteriohopanetetrol glucosamine biosynthesis glycosyltransferase HpnI [Terriglobales bacterium]|nr:bacteriohopanetetrol glucosamine biosynthesis glycosyltransferase HpnI [Terriglobales bacterium]
MLRLAIQSALSILTLCGIGFCFVSIWSARRFRQSAARQAPTGFAPAVSILKPVKGADADSYEAFRSHCLQDYGGEYQIIFGVNDAADPAISLVQKLIAEFPARDIRLVICSEVFGTNRKVSNLMHLLREAKCDYVLVNDGDIHVSPDYLRAVMGPFCSTKLGMVTCLYRGRSSNTFGSRLEALGISTHFAAGVLTAWFMEGGLRFGLGSTLAMSRSALDRIGGFEAVVEYLADDYQLGKRIAEAGFEVELAPMVVETSVPPYSFRRFWEHQIRWARTMRVSRPGGYGGLALTHPLAWSILLLFVSPGVWWFWILLIAAFAARATSALTTGWVTLQDRFLFRDFWLLPLRDLLALATWIWSYAGNSITWRGEQFRLKDGRMLPVSRAQSSSHAEPGNPTPAEAQRR